MCLIMLMLLRVATSESMIFRPCFLPLLYYLLSVLLHVTLLLLLFQITQITFFTPYYTTFIVSLSNQCICTITIVLDVFRTQENHHITTPSIVLLHLLFLIYFDKCFSGLAKLTTQLLRLIGILWLPLCRINKLGYTYPRRLSRSPIVVGYQ